MTISDQNPSTSPSTRQPMINIPPLTFLLMLALTIVHLVRVFALSPEDDQMLVMHLGFMPKFLHDAGLHMWQPWASLVTYSLLHFGWPHFIVNITALVAFGSATERVFGRMRYMVILLAGVIAGALIHFAFYSESTILLGGMSAGLSALFAVVLGVMQLGRTQTHVWRAMIKPTLAWVVVNIVIGLMGVPGQPGLAVGWVAHLGGFAAGLLCLPLFVTAYRFWKKDHTHG